MPTKQNEEYYGLLVSTDANFNHTVYMHSYAAHFKKVMKLPFEKRHLTNHNTQLRAPLQFHYLIEYGKSFEHGNLEMSGFISIGVSSGAVLLAAHQLGLKTGICSCLDAGPLLENINKEFNTQYNSILLSIGFGYPKEGLSHNIAERPDGSLSKKQTYTKEIKIFRK